ncbi:MAG: NAD(P)/FAD-dependent oxidoreductase [Verrucomicrobiota bacterium]
MSNYDYDFVVIGGGSGGYAAARTAHDLGLKTAVIDSAEELGGLCILRGCMPSKTLIESSNRYRSLRRAEEFGLQAEAKGVSADKINDRKKVLIDDFASYRQGQLNDGRFDLIRGAAEFIDSHQLAVQPNDGGQLRKISFASACIASGSSVMRLPLPGIEEAGYWTSRDILDARELPDSIIVLGGGAIALEMACYMEGLGKQVTVIQRSEELITGADKDVADALFSALDERDNMTLYTETGLEKVTVDADGSKRVHFLHKGASTSVAAEQILMALGRTPNSKTLCPELAGIELATNGKHLGANEEMASSQPHIFAAGDVCGPHEVVHTAIEQGEIAAHNAAVYLGKQSGEPQKISYRLKLLGIFTDPQVAMVGLTEAEAKAEGIDVVTASYPFDDHGKSMVMGETHGFVKLIAKKGSGELVGGAVIGPEATELIHEIVVALHFRCTGGELLRIPHYHPTLSEIWTYPAEDVDELAREVS